MTLQARISTLFGISVDDTSEVDASFLPPEDAENPFEAAVLAAQDGQPELNLHGLFAGVLAGKRSDGAGDLYCPGFEPGRVRVYEYHHDERFVWSAAADSFGQLDAMLAVLEQLLELSVDPAELFDQIDQDALDEAEGWEARLALVPDDDVRAALGGWPACEPPSSFDFSEWRDLIGPLVPRDAGLVTRSDGLNRSVWVAAALSGDGTRLGSAPPDAEIDSLLSKQLAVSEPVPSDALYWLWCAWLTGRDAAAKEWCDKAERSSSTLLRGAGATVRRMLAGQTRIGSVDLASFRKLLVDRGKVAPGELSADELAQRRTQVKSLILPTLREWNDALLSYTSVEDLETRVNGYPPEVGKLVKLRRLAGPGPVPPEISALTELTTLECGDLPADVAALTKLSTLRMTKLTKGDPCPSIAQLSNLEELYLFSVSDIDLPESWQALTRLRRIELHADNKKIRLCSALGQLPSLETLILHGHVAAFPADFSGAKQLHTVILRGGRAPSLAPLASAPALRNLVLQPDSQKKPGADANIEVLPQLESLELVGHFADAATLIGSVRKLPKLARLSFQVWSGAKSMLPPELVGIDVRELHVRLPLDPDWALLGRILKGAPSLRSVKVSSISAPSGETIEQPIWPELTELDMSECSKPLTNLFPSAAALPKLERLVLAHFGATLHRNKEPLTFLDGIEACTELREALLGGYLLRPEHVAGVCKLSGLRVLDMRYTGLSEVPDAIGNLSKLELLDLRQTPLTTLPAALGRLPLETLLLGETQIESLDHVEVPRTLKHLDISGPALSNAPSWLPELHQLVRLEIGGAALDLPAALGLALKLPALKILVIRNVKRDGLPPELFSFTRLDVLQLEACNFKVNLSQLRMRIPEVSLLLPP